MAEINWNILQPQNIGMNALASFQQGQQMRREQDTRKAMAAYAQNPNDANALNALAPYAPDYVVQQKQSLAKDAEAKQQAAVAQRVEMIGQVAQWADTPEKWDKGVDYLASMYPDLAQYRGKFTPEARMAAISAAGEYKNFAESQKPINAGPGTWVLGPDGKTVLQKVPFAPRPVTVGEGQTVVEYAPGAGGGTADPASVFQRMIGAESNGQHFAANGGPLTSPKGAVGIAQVMPTTGPEAAAAANLPWDENRYRTDPEYNKALGQAYFQQQLQVFGGDTAKAVAAYNAGPGRVQQAMQKGGANWQQYLPAETQAYLGKVLGPAGSRVIAQGAPKQPKQPDAPSGYRFKPDGSLEPIPGGPAAKPDPKSDPGYSQSAMDAFNRAIDSANRLIKHPGFNAGVGVPSINPLDGNLAGYIVPGSNAADFRAELDALKAQVFLPMVQSMKGMGALSNAEGEKLTASIGALDTKMSEGAFRASLQRIIKDLQTYRDRTNAPAQLPARAASQPAQKKRLRYNPATGNLE